MRARLITDVSEAATILRQGGLVAFATETVYGLGGDARNVEAIAGIFEAKQRPHFDPLIVHLADPEQISSVVSHVPPVAQKLIDHFWPGPLTLVLPKQPDLPDLVTSGLPTVAVRVPNHPIARELIRLAGVPVAAPSANPFGRISPTTAQHVLDLLEDKIDAVLDGGPCTVGIESTVLECNDQGEVRLLRPGGLTVEEIEAIVGPLAGRAPTVLDQHASAAAMPAPGMLAQHYAPRTPLRIVEDWPQELIGEEVGILSLKPIANPERYGKVEVLSESGMLKEATANFFAAMRRLDESPVKLILAQRFPENGLGRALNDRLQRAASPNAT